MGLAQTERLEKFLKLRSDIAKLYLDAVADCEYLVPQKVPKGCNNTYWTVAMRYEHKDISWKTFVLSL